MLAPIDTPDLVKAQLLARLHETLPELTLPLEEGFASLTLDLPCVPVAAPELSVPHFLLSRADRRELRAGYGIAAEWRAAGPERLTRLRTDALRLRRCWHRWDPDGTGLNAFALLGFSAAPGPASDDTAADGLPDAVLWLPEIAVGRSGARAALTLTTRLPADPSAILQRWAAWIDRLVPRLFHGSQGPRAPAPVPAMPERRWAHPDRDGWDLRVSAALEAIANGDLDKVVLARRLCVHGRRPFDLDRLVAALSRLFPSCQVVKLRRDGHCLVAATPERLLALHGGRVEVDAIAGTAARAPGRVPDAALGEALRTSPKELHEHAVVTESLCAALGPHSRLLQVPQAPRLLQLSNVQHLWTPIRAELEPGWDALALADLLHPTAATSGHPGGAARAWLVRTEHQGRGWYTGVAGCLDPDLGGELWVLLRCAEIAGDTALLHAGAGIVAGSEPGAEWGETDAKLAAMLTALRFA